MSDFDEQEKKDQEYRKEVVELKKVRQGQTPNVFAEEHEKQAQQPKAPMTGKQKLVNFWYHYRGAVIAVVLLFALAGYFLWDVLSRPEYDLTTYVSTAYPMGNMQEPIEKMFTQYAGDHDKDGTVRVGVSLVTIKEEGEKVDQQYQTANQMKMMGALMNGEPILFLVDDVSYRYMSDGKYFADLSGYAKADAANVKQIKGKRFYIKGTQLEKELVKAAGISEKDFPGDLSLVLRDTKELDMSDQKVKETYAYTETVVSNLINGTKAAQ